MTGLGSGWEPETRLGWDVACIALALGLRNKFGFLDRGRAIDITFTRQGALRLDRGGSSGYFYVDLSSIHRFFTSNNAVPVMMN